MNKTYKTGLSTWTHNDDIYQNGQPRYKLLGPCPQCGCSTFNYGGGWRCNAQYCQCNENNPAPNMGKAPAWWNSDINVYIDGNSWCAVRDDFTNLQESNAGFGKTPQEAVNELIKEDNS